MARRAVGRRHGSVATFGGSATASVSEHGLLPLAGTVRASYAYDAYGARTAITGSTGDTPFGFGGEYTDGESGMASTKH